MKTKLLVKYLLKVNLNQKEEIIMNKKCKKWKNKIKDFKKKLNKLKLKLLQWNSSNYKFNSSFKLNSISLNQNNKDLERLNKKKELLLLKFNKCNNNLKCKKHKWKQKNKD